MAELPEAETIRRDLQRTVVGLTMESVGIPCTPRPRSRLLSRLDPHV
jgi:formamidopyrimidine-DNA glycosylase